MTPALADQAQALRGGRAAAPPLLAITGAKGGVGKTLLAVNLALLLARAGRRTLLVDLDPGLGNVDVHLRLSPGHTVEDLAAGTCTAEQALADGPAGLQVLAGRSGSTLLAGGDPEPIRRALAAVLAAGGRSDLVVCDTGAGIGPAVLAVAAAATLAVAVTTPDPAAVTDTYALCKLLHARGRPLPHLLVNRVADREEGLRTAGRLATVTRRFLGAELPFLGWLRHAPALELSVAQQQPLVLEGQGPPVEDLRALAASLLSLLPAAVRPRPALERLRPPGR